MRSVESQDDVLVKLPMVRTLLFSRCVHLPWLSEEQRTTVDRLAGSGLVSLENSQGRLTERGYRLAFAEPWYAGGRSGVLLVRTDGLRAEARLAGQGAGGGGGPSFLTQVRFPSMVRRRGVCVSGGSAANAHE